jgi:3-oxoacyl-(acyl-carrier-protein) synthase
VKVRVASKGVVSALGLTADEHFAGLLEGRSALTGSPVAGRIDRERARAELARRAPELARAAERFEEVLLGLALAEAGAPRGTLALVGTTKGVLEPFLLEAGLVPLVVSQACASSTQAIALGAALIEAGEVSRVVTGGAEALSPFIEEGFASLSAIDPRGSRPFDATRLGLSLGEGAAVLVLERGTSGAHIVGTGSGSDAFSSTSPDPEGRGLERALRGAIAGCDEAPGFVCAHGTGTEKNDAAEILGLERVVPGARVFSIKGRVGHTLGAAGALDAATALLALEKGAIPGTAREPISPRVTRETERVAARTVLSANAGFGGLCAALAFRLSPGEAAGRP